MFNSGQKNKLSDTVSKWLELVLIKSLEKKKETNKTQQPEAKTGKVKKDWKQSFVMENVKQHLSLGMHCLQ